MNSVQWNISTEVIEVMGILWFQCCELHKLDTIHLHCIRVAAEISEVDVS